MPASPDLGPSLYSTSFSILHGFGSIVVQVRSDFRSNFYSLLSDAGKGCYVRVKC